jgi:cytochrome c biogenesis protein CcdA
MAAAPAAAPGESSTVLEDRFRRFTLGTVVTAGLVDGFNPCAFATIVFFVSLLTVSGVRGSRVLLVGLSFGAAVFATYLALGFGVFRLLSALTAWRAAAGVLNAVMVAALAVLALLSFRDAWRFGRSGRPADVVLQLPDRIKRRIHAIMRERLSLRHLVPSTALIGVLVTLLESVCTGQVYVPTLVFLTTHPELGRRAWTLLVIYNVMFVVPLAVVTAAACYGTRSQRLMEWSRRNVVRSKVLLGLFFAGLAVVLLVF